MYIDAMTYEERAEQERLEETAVVTTAYTIPTNDDMPEYAFVVNWEDGTATAIAGGDG